MRVIDRLLARICVGLCFVLLGFTPSDARAAVCDARSSLLGEIGVTQPDGLPVWKVFGPDGDAGYGGLQGIGGLEAFVAENTGAVTPVVTDDFGHVVAHIAGGSAQWAPTRPEGYGLLPEGAAAPARQLEGRLLLSFHLDLVF